MEDNTIYQKSPDAGLENILRSRTFNPELKDLINRIGDNEAAPARNRGKKDSSRVDIVRGMHSLFYKIKYSYELQESSSPAIPDGFDFNREPDSESVAELVLSQILNMGFDSGAVLGYDFQKKGFSPLSSKNTGSDIFVGIESKIYDRIINSNFGFIMTAEEIAEDQYTSKLFSTGKGISDTYFLNSSFAAEEIRNSFSLGSSFISDRLSPLLCVSAESLNISPEDLFEIIKKDTGVYFILMQKFLNSSIKKYAGKSFLDPAMLDLFLRIYSTGDHQSVFNIGLTHNKSSEMIYMLIYLAEKIKFALSGKGIVLRFTPDTILVFSGDDFLYDLSGIMIDFESISANSFYMKKYTPEELLRSDFILKKYF